jgi:hypothetical protein
MENRVSVFRGVADLVVEAASLYELAKADAVYAREVWVAAGSPLEQRTQGVHPLRRALVEADDRVARRARDLAQLTMRTPRRGRPPGAVSAPDRDAPAVKLKVAG